MLPPRRSPRLNSSQVISRKRRSDRINGLTAFSWTPFLAATEVGFFDVLRQIEALRKFERKHRVLRKTEAKTEALRELRELARRREAERSVCGCFQAD